MDNSNLPLFLVGIVAFTLFTALSIAFALYFLQRYTHPELTDMQKRLIHIKNLHEDDLKAYDEKQVSVFDMIRPKAYDNEALGKFFRKYSFTNSIELSIKQAGLVIPVDKFMMWFLIIPFVAFMVLALVLKMFYLILAAIGLPFLVMFALGLKKKQRLAKFVSQMPDALSLLTSSLRAGHSFHSAVGVIAEEMSQPISGEFAVVVNDINLGVPLKDSLGRLTSSLDLPDLYMFSTAILIQREAGGNLAEVLDKLGYTIRERFKLKGQIAALTGQSRLTGYVLGFAPLALGVILTLFFPAYIAPLYESPVGWVMLGIAIVMQIIGGFIMMKVIEIRV